MSKPTIKVVAHADGMVEIRTECPRDPCKPHIKEKGGTSIFMTAETADQVAVDLSLAAHWREA